MTHYEERQAEKARWDKYREAAARLYPTAHLRHMVAVQETADKDGAFIEVVVWVPRSEILPAPTSAQLVLDFDTVETCGATQTIGRMPEQLVCDEHPGHKLPHYDSVRELYFVVDGEPK